MDITPQVARQRKARLDHYNRKKQDPAWVERRRATARARYAARCDNTQKMAQGMGVSQKRLSSERRASQAFVCKDEFAASRRLWTSVLLEAVEDHLFPSVYASVNGYATRARGFCTHARHSQKRGVLCSLAGFASSWLDDKLAGMGG